LVWCLAVAGGLVATVATVVALRGGMGGAGGKVELADAGSPPPPATGAFAAGGRPTGGQPALDRAFGKDLPDYAITLDKWATERRAGHAADDGALAAARQAVLAEDARQVLGDAASTALAALLDRARDVAVAPSGELDRAADALSRAVLAFDDQLAAAGLGYLVDSDVMEYLDDGRRLVLLFSFTVEQVVLYRTANGDVRALHLRRLDELNWTYALLGFTSPRRREALILVAQVEERLVDRLLPQFGQDPPPFFLLEEEDRQTDWYPLLAARAVEVIRGEYGVGTGDRNATERLGELLARRKQLFSAWDRGLSRRGISIESPTAMRLDWDYRKELAGLIAEGDLHKLAEIEKALESEVLAASFDAARAVLIRSVERHEVQHRIDNTHADPLPMPAALEEFVGPLTGPGGKANESATHARAELSAYLSELARDPDTAGVATTILVQFAIAPPHWGTSECYAALVILEELAKELDLPGREPLVAAHAVERGRVTATYIALTNVPRAQLRDAARRLWERMFARPLETISTAPR